MKRILRYLKGTPSHGISIILSTFSITCFTDADWANCPDERLSTNGYCPFLGASLISWSSSKQKTVSRSSSESKYRGLANAAVEIAWVSSMIKELNFLHPIFPCYYVTTLVPLTLLPILCCINALNTLKNRSTLCSRYDSSTTTFRPKCPI